MNAVAASVLVVLHFTLPNYNADNVCGTSIVPLDDLATVEAHWQPLGTATDSVLTIKDEHAKEGLADTLGVLVPAGGGSLWLVATDTAGNHSCGQTDTLHLAATTGVDCKPPVKAPERVVWYDILGRRIDAPRASGIYFRVQGNTRQRVVIWK